MIEIKNNWELTVRKALSEYAVSLGICNESFTSTRIMMQTPPKPEMGDFAIPFFPFSKIFRKAPHLIASEVKNIIEGLKNRPKGTISADGPYLNIKTDLVDAAKKLWEKIDIETLAYGRNRSMNGQKIMIEFSCPNTNKPLHLGHLRNNIIGESTAEILKANGADVQKVNLINDRGVHICKSMLAYMQFGNERTPRSENKKSDHFVGDFYVKYNDWAINQPDAEKEAQKLLVKWENGDKKTIDLWSKMNTWAVDGIFETYQTTGISFDKLYYESETYMLGKDLVLQGLENGIFTKEKDGSVWIDLSEIGLDKKILLRSDGTSLYITQDLGTAVSRHEDWPFNKQIYVVASEQQYHFKVLFYILKKLGFSWADNLFHLSYGMVNLPDGKMKSREGTVVDADDLLKTLAKMAKREIIQKNREDDVEDLTLTSSSIALAALNYYLLQVNPTKDMIFNPAESISFNGNTGPYLQYMGARITSMLKKYELVEKENSSPSEFNPSLLDLQDEHALLKQIMLFPETVELAGKELNPTIIAGYLYDLSRMYSRYYHDHRILDAGADKLIYARVVLSKMVLQILKNAYILLGIPFLESM
ncbi:MAG: arginine--tRNA ligase [Spirochaetales bacterium]|nr:arginine--tRNA ligase [Spirochaetales bacterium]